MRVIGTGFGRTGTDSMREALNLLGVGPCHHMRELADPDQKAAWRAVVGGAVPDWDRLLGGYGSCIDWPTAAYWRALIAHWPQAKVILTWRDAESWYRSFSRTILPAIVPGNDPESVGERLIRDTVFGGRPDDPAHAMAVYEANVAAVRAEVPAERLLVYRLGDGWEPLCAHLGLAVPDMPFPHANTTSDFQRDAEARRED